MEAKKTLPSFYDAETDFLTPHDWDPIDTNPSGKGAEQAAAFLAGRMRADESAARTAKRTNDIANQALTTLARII